MSIVATSVLQADNIILVKKGGSTKNTDTSWKEIEGRTDQ